MDNQRERSGRIKFIDGLRAVAVLMVMFFHFYYQQISDAGQHNVTPTIAQETFQYGNMGVYVFFVISGFIVSYITYGQITGFKFIASFIVKRQVRLDPPFWLAVAMGVVLPILSIRFLNNDVYMPTTKDIFFNCIYLFGIFDMYDIIRVGWTLCLEIQFYLMFIGLVYAVNTYIKSSTGKSVVYFIIYLGSLLCYCMIDGRLNDYIVHYWFIFFFGVALTWRLYNEISDGYLVAVFLAPYLMLLTDVNMVPVYFASVTALSIYVAFKWNKEGIWLSNRGWQFFGLISYSLYLTHCLIGNKLIRILKLALNWEPGSFGLTFLLLFLSVAISTTFAYVYYFLIEKRSIVWSRKISSMIK